MTRIERSGQRRQCTRVTPDLLTRLDTLANDFAKLNGRDTPSSQWTTVEFKDGVTLKFHAPPEMTSSDEFLGRTVKRIVTRAKAGPDEELSIEIGNEVDDENDHPFTSFHVAGDADQTFSIADRADRLLKGADSHHRLIHQFALMPNGIIAWIIAALILSEDGILGTWSLSLVTALSTVNVTPSAVLWFIFLASAGVQATKEIAYPRIEVDFHDSYVSPAKRYRKALTFLATLAISAVVSIVISNI